MQEKVYIKRPCMDKPGGKRALPEVGQLIVNGCYQ